MKISEFKASMAYITSSRPATPTLRDPVSNRYFWNGQFTPVISVLWRTKHEDLHEFESWAFWWVPGQPGPKTKQKNLRLTDFSLLPPGRTALDSRSHGAQREGSRVFLLYLSRAFSLFSWTFPLSWAFSSRSPWDLILSAHFTNWRPSQRAGVFPIGLFSSSVFLLWLQLHRSDAFPLPMPPLRLFFLIQVFLPLRLTGIAIRACVAQAGPKLTCS